MPPSVEVKMMVDQAKKTGNWKELRDLVYLIFSDRAAVGQCFLQKNEDGKYLKPTETNAYIDFKEMDDVYELLRASDNSIANTLGNAIYTMTTYSFETLSSRSAHSKEISFPLEQIRAFIILLDNPRLWQNQDFQKSFKDLLITIAGFSDSSLSVLSKWVAEFSQDRLRDVVGLLQQFITIKWMSSSGASKRGAIQHATVVLGIFYEANEIQATNMEFKEGETVLNYREFYNDVVDEELGATNMEIDYTNWVMRKGFTFANHAYILDAGCKAKLLQRDSRLQMRNAAVTHRRSEWYLVLKVHRDNLIRDTMRQLQMKNGSDYKKPLKIQFIGEDGIDEGGVKKEFFQLMIEQLFDPQYGMFEYMEETRTYWFLHHSLESVQEFELIGILLGLAIYNRVLLNVRFPDLVYKKLMQKSLDLKDFTNVFPEMGKALSHLLEFEGDVQSTYCRNFTASYKVFGETRVDELKKGGADIELTNDNRKEYVDLYIKYKLDKSIQKQFNAFYKGFILVCGGPPLKLFRWEEIKLLVCGHPTLDFEALEETCRYEDGYTADSKVVEYFWEVIGELALEDKKKFLFFCSGSDRAPIKGLGRLNFVISRQGPDSDRLPSAHTCFNHLLLPEYDTKEKLKKLLLLALENSKGFGLL